MQKGQPKSTHKKLIVIFCLLIVIIVALVISIIVVNNSANQSTESSSPTIPALDEYIAETDEIISSAATPEEAAKLYTERVNEIYSRCEESCDIYQSKILSDAYQAESLAPTAETAWLIYNLESLYGHTAEAENYLNIAKERGYDTEGAW